jgi:hypothetical protein
MARRGGGEGGGGMGGSGGMMAPVLSIATGLLIFVILIIFAPTIAGSIERAQPALGAENNWNASHRNWSGEEALPNGVQEWTTNIQILGVVILIISIAVAMYYLKGMA